MSRRSTSISIGFAIALVGLLASAVLASPRNFTAPLDSDQEVATEPVDSDATGVAHFQLSRDGQSLDYRLIVANIENVTMAHIHLASCGENGDVVVWLYPDGPPPVAIDGRSQGVLAEGTITEDDLVGPLEDESFDDLLSEMREGNTYVNVHTEQFPPGEIRGQIDRPRGHTGDGGC